MSQDVQLNTELLYLITAGCERILTKPKGCLLLVGRLGIGRNLAVRIVASRHNATLMSPKIRPIFNLNALKNDLKTVRTAYLYNNRLYFIGRIPSIPRQERNLI